MKKLSHAGQLRVSKKIKKLVREGYSVEQASAIAYSMERKHALRGEYLKNPHSSGHWHYVKHTKDYEILSNEKSIASTHDLPDHDEETESNAALISAAPELLKSLRNLLKLADTVMKKEGSITDSIRDDARLAIYKATHTSYVDSGKTNPSKMFYWPEKKFLDYLLNHGFRTITSPEKRHKLLVRAIEHASSSTKDIKHLAVLGKKILTEGLPSYGIIGSQKD